MKLNPAKTPKRPPNVAKTNIKCTLPSLLILLYFNLNSLIWKEQLINYTK